MKFEFVPPLFIRAIFSKTIWQNKSDSILLTFDDGPNAETTPIILAKLKQHNIKGLFFVVGNNVLGNREVLLRIMEDGHVIGNHSLNHRKLLFLSEAEIKKEVIETEIALYKEGITCEKLFRPPYGKFGFTLQRAISTLGYKNIMWSLLTFDYKNNLKVVKFAVQKYLKRNSIIVLHDNKKSMPIIQDSIDFIVETAYDKGYTFGDPTQCLK